MSLRKARAIGAVAACLALSFAALTTPSAVAAPIVSPNPVTLSPSGTLYWQDTLTVSAGDTNCAGATGAEVWNHNTASGIPTTTISATGDFAFTIAAGSAVLPAGSTVTLNVYCGDSMADPAVDALVAFLPVTLTVAPDPTATASPNPVLTTGTVTITGTNFKPGNNVTLWLDGYPTFTAGPKTIAADGTVSFSIPVSNPAGDGSVPALTPGAYLAFIIDGDASVEVPFTVQAPAPPPGPTSGTMPRLGSDVA